jgi:hypothetical protein
MELDIEHQMDPEGITEGYSFDQTETTITISFPVPPGSSLSDLVYSVDLESRSIVAGVKDSAPSVCGVMAGAVAEAAFALSASAFTIALRKASPGIWPVFVARPSPAGIDAKSLYVLAMASEAEGRACEAWAQLQMAADRLYAPAQLEVALALTSADNRFGVAPDAGRAAALLRAIPAPAAGRAVQIALCNALLAGGRDAEAAEVLRAVRDLTDDERLDLVQLLDRGAGNDGEVVAHLRLLAERGVPQAMWKLAQRMLAGRGVPADRRAALELARRAIALDPDIAFGPAELGTGVAVLALLLIALGIGLWFLLRRRR